MRVLDQAARFRGYPRAVRTDNGPEFTSRAFIAWTQQHSIQHLLIEPGRPMQNGYIESFNGKLRDECLNVAGSNPRRHRRVAPRLQLRATAQQLRTHSTGPVFRQSSNQHQPTAVPFNPGLSP